jgi:hypothetical protein
MRVHTPACRRRMESILDRTEEGRHKKARHEDRTNEVIAEKISQTIAEEVLIGPDDADDHLVPGQSAAGASSSSRLKRDRDECVEKEPNAKTRAIRSLRISNLSLGDMCERDNGMLKDHFDTFTFYDDNDGSELDPTLVAKGCEDEMKRFREMGVYEVVPRTAAKKAKIIRTRWVRVKKGSRREPMVKCRLVAMEFANTVRDDLFAGTPPLFALRLLTSLTASKSNYKIMILDVKCVFLYGHRSLLSCLRKIHIADADLILDDCSRQCTGPGTHR